jgi:hypothetical protein
MAVLFLLNVVWEVGLLVAPAPARAPTRPNGIASPDAAAKVPRSDVATPPARSATSPAAKTGTSSVTRALQAVGALYQQAPPAATMLAPAVRAARARSLALSACVTVTDVWVGWER